MKESSLFIAIKGDTYDGHAYLRQAAAGGAVAALVQQVPDPPLRDLQMILVPDTRKAMGKLAGAVRKKMTSKVIGVAGSNGKTSTKHLIHAALRHDLSGSISPKSFNNDIGVPLTIFPANPLNEYLVLEIGTNHPGEIKNLADMAQPDIAVITNCGPEHLEFLGDLMGVRRENASIISGLSRSGCLIVNGDDPELLEAVAPYPGKKITFGFKDTNDLFASDIECDASGVRFRLNGGKHKVFVPMLGRHTACNSLCAIAVARRMGLSEDQIIRSLARAEGPEMRLQLQTTESGITLVNDAYNANPASMKAALDTIAALPAEKRRIAILGDMKELGPATDRFHREVGEHAARSNFDALYCIGPKAALIAEAAQQQGMKPAAIVHFPDSNAAASSLAKALRRGDVVLLKASRSVQLETIADAITNPQPPLRKAAS